MGKPMTDEQDWELVKRAQDGDMQAFSRLVERYQSAVIHFCERMLGQRNQGEDLAQECFVRVYRHLHRLTPQARFTTVLFGIARNLTLNALRDAKRRGQHQSVSLDEAFYLHSSEPSPVSRTYSSELNARIHQALDRLRPDHKEILLLREFEGFDYEELARVLGCKKGTVKSRLARAREALRQELTTMGVVPNE